MPNQGDGGGVGRRRHLGLLMLGAILVPQYINAQVLFEFNLPPQPLDQSLLALATKTHVTVAFDPSALAGRQAPALTGAFSLRRALDLLLRGSGFRAKETAGGSFWIEEVPAREPPG